MFIDIIVMFDGIVVLRVHGDVTQEMVVLLLLEFELAITDTFFLL